MDLLSLENRNLVNKLSKDLILDLEKKNPKSKLSYNRKIKLYLDKQDGGGNEFACKIVLDKLSQFWIEELFMTIQTAENNSRENVVRSLTGINVKDRLNECIKDFKDSAKSGELKGRLRNNICSYHNYFDRLNGMTYFGVSLKHVENSERFGKVCQKKGGPSPLGTIFNDNIEHPVTNKYDIEFQLFPGINLKSFRYGTMISKPHDKSVYYSQCDYIMDKIGNRRIIVVSLLDWPRDEKDIVEVEFEKYNPVENIAFFNLLCNNILHIPAKISVPDSSLHDPNVDKLRKILKDLRDRFDDVRIIHNLYNSLSVFQKNLNDPSVNIELDNFKNGIVSFTTLSIDKDKFVYRKNVKGESIKLNRIFKRYIMFCYLSLLVAFVNIIDPENPLDLYYHCKSGQDRTGTFYAINQTVNMILKDRYDEIVKSILEDGVMKTILRYFCPFYDTRDRGELHRFYDYTYKHLSVSYLIAWASTGVPGIKWAIGKKMGLVHLENYFAYLLLEKAEDAKLFDGLSPLRSS